MHIGMRLLHPAADHSVSISRQQVQRIFRFSLRSRAGDPAAQRWYSSRGDGTWRLRSLLQGTRVTYVTVTFPISRSLRVTSGDRRIGIPTKRPRILPLPVSCGASCAPTFWRRSGLHKKTSYCCYGTTHSVRLDNTGKTYPFHLEQKRCGSPTFPKEVQKHLRIWTTVYVHMED